MKNDMMNPDRNSNKVRVVGKIKDINFRQGKNKNGADYISYTMHVRVNQTVNGQLETSEIEVGGYANKFTKQGALNSFYTTIDNLHTLKTIETVGLDDADIIRLNAGRLQDNSFVSKNTKQLVKAFRVDNSAFFEKGSPADPETAEFVGDVVVMNMTDETDSNGDFTGRITVKAAMPKYGGEIDVFDFIVEEPTLVERIQNGWNVGETVPLKAHIRATKKEVVRPVAEDTDSWGEDFSSGSNTITVRELVVTGARPAYPEETGYDSGEVRKAYNNYKARIEQMMADANGKKATRSTASAGWDD